MTPDQDSSVSSTDTDTGLSIPVSQYIKKLEGNVKRFCLEKISTIAAVLIHILRVTYRSRDYRTSVPRTCTNFESLLYTRFPRPIVFKIRILNTTSSGSKFQCRRTAATSRPWMWQNFTNIYRIAVFRYADLTMMVMIFPVFKTLSHIPCRFLLRYVYTFSSEETIVVTMDGLGGRSLCFHAGFCFFLSPCGLRLKCWFFARNTEIQFIFPCIWEKCASLVHVFLKYTVKSAISSFIYLFTRCSTLRTRVKSYLPYN